MHATPNEVTPRTTDATAVSTSQRQRESAQPRSRSANCSIRGNDSNTRSEYQVTMPSSFRCWFLLRSMADPRMSVEAYGLTTAFRASRGGRRKVKLRDPHKEWPGWMIECGGPDHRRTVGTLLPKVVLSILWMRTRRMAAVSSFGSGWSWGRTWMMNAEVTVENRPACESNQHIADTRNVGSMQRSGWCSSLRRIP